jgi:protein TonB
MLEKLIRTTRWIAHRVAVTVGALALTLGFFLLLPLMQQISAPAQKDVNLTSAETVTPPPPEPPKQEPPEPEEKEEPKMEQPQQQLQSLEQMELALGEGGAGTGGASIQINIANQTQAGQAGAGLFSMAQLDQRPQLTYAANPQINQQVRQASPGSVTVIFIVNRQGKVEQVQVQQSTHPALEQPVVEAVKKYRFQPGQRQGQAVRFRMKRKIRFPNLKSG